MDLEVPIRAGLVCWDKLAVGAEEVESDGLDSVTKYMPRNNWGSAGKWPPGARGTGASRNVVKQSRGSTEMGEMHRQPACRESAGRWQHSLL